MAKPTVRDIAKHAGVSLATVDRVLNSRPGVRQKTVDRVHSSIRELGFVRDMSAANLARQRMYRFAFLLPDTPGQFVDTLKSALKEASVLQLAERTLVKVLPITSHDPHAVVRTLSQLGRDGYDGAAIMAPETPQVRDAIVRLKEDGFPTVALVSDLPNSPRDHFVGINNIAAGRTAGVLMGRFLRREARKVLVVAGSMLARDSIERRLGFDGVMAESFSGISVLPTLETHDDPERMVPIIAAAFKANPDIAGVYSLGSGNQALLDALNLHRSSDDLTIIVHELTPNMRIALKQEKVDAVITQNVGHLVRSAVRVLRAKCDQVAILESQERIRIDIVMRENLP